MIRPYFKPKVYLSARISPDAHDRNNRVASYLTDSFDVFKPHDFQVCEGPHEDIGYDIFLQDLRAMQASDLCLLVPPYGRDVSWEIGWYFGQGKPTFLYCEEDLSWRRDAMIKGGLSAVLTANPATYEILKSDLMLRQCAYLLEKPEDLGQTVLQLYDDLKNGRVLMGGR